MQDVISVSSPAFGWIARCGHVYALLAPFAGIYVDFLIDRVLGEVGDSLRGDWGGGSRHLASAEAVARREEVWPEWARTRTAQATLALRAGGPAHATGARSADGTREGFARWRCTGIAMIPIAG